jgi:hypothetical protein
MFMLLFGLGLPALVGAGIAALPVKSDGDRSALVWAFVFPAIFVGFMAGAWLDAQL